MDFQLTQGTEVLAATPATLRALLGGLGPAWTNASEAPGKWTSREIVAHLIDGDESDWIPRVRKTLEGTAWEPYDPEGFRERYADTPLDGLLDRLAEVRGECLTTLRGFDLGEADFDRTAEHPVFGTVTLRQHLATWVTHDLSHTRQLCRVLAKQYRVEVGPWTAYLPILAE